MRPRLIKSWLTLIAVLIGLLLSACTNLQFFYTARAIEGRIVDPEQQPLGGVIIVAYWQLKGGPEGNTPIRELQIYETVTDANGRYSFPGWGPRFALTGELRDESPGLLLYKEGYKFRQLHNDWDLDRTTSRSMWNGKTVELEPFKGTLAEYSIHLRLLNNHLSRIGYSVGDHSGDYCGWRSFPKMLKAMDDLREKLLPLRMGGITVAAELRAVHAQLRAAGCGTVEDLLGK